MYEGEETGEEPTLELDYSLDPEDWADSIESQYEANDWGSPW